MEKVLITREVDVVDGLFWFPIPFSSVENKTFSRGLRKLFPRYYVYLNREVLELTLDDFICDLLYV